ncbi:response regulator [Paenibacillus albus]|uniref:Response regulator n=1 Tax=Paenibacillus albus TaxID=2495582 RepID=A0A3Q8X4J3_9BACL|nr:response regulator [Paenibacillus albus]AZN40320.1 response regulator [Paenibacillus albus]
MRTLLVDDEHFVRKGLLLTVPWKQYGFEIIGEAENGLKALDLLQHTAIDVLFTDLTMPKMNGFELMKKVKEDYPGIQIVVLTCHQEFDYAIEALQIGAIDYLVKTQIEEGKVEAALERISKRIQADAKQRAEVQSNADATAGWDLAIVPRTSGVDLSMMGFETATQTKPFHDDSWIVSHHGYDNWQALHVFWERNGLYASWMPVVIPMAKEQGYPGKREWHDFLEYDVFYAYRSDHPLPFIYKKAEDAGKHAVVQSDVERLRSTFHTLKWLFDDHSYMEWIGMVEAKAPAAGEVRRMVADSLEALQNVQGISDELRVLINSLNSITWHGLCALLAHLRKQLMNSEYPPETCLSIYRALLLIHTEVAEDLNQENVAQRVALSRSYFSQCFRPLVGMSFHELLTHMRIKKAAALLAGSSLYIYEIAEQTGFNDEKYFSRVFKQHKGMLPKDYRESARLLQQ